MVDRGLRFRNAPHCRSASKVPADPPEGKAIRLLLSQVAYLVHDNLDVLMLGTVLVVPSIAFDEMSGSAKGVTAAKSRGRKYIRNRGYGGGVRTSAQAAVKSVFKQLTQSWKNLTNAQILAWNALAQTQAGKSVLGTASKITGANLYTRLNYWIVQTGGAALATPPTLVGVDTPAEADLDLSADAFNLQLTDMPENVADLRLIIQASAPQSNGISRAYSKAVQIGAAREVVDEMINIKDDYEAVHGAVTEAAPKVFLKYFFVNTKTGEKSGEMLATVKLW